MTRVEDVRTPMAFSAGRGGHGEVFTERAGGCQGRTSIGRRKLSSGRSNNGGVSMKTRRNFVTQRI